MTPTQAATLTLIRDIPDIQAGRIAEKLWPDSLMHKRHYNTGHGACVGKGAWLFAGSYVGKLIKKGWVRRKYDEWRDYDTGETRIGATHYRLTRAGLEALEQYEEL